MMTYPRYFIDINPGDPVTYWKALSFKEVLFYRGCYKGPSICSIKDLEEDELNIKEVSAAEFVLIYGHL